MRYAVLLLWILFGLAASSAQSLPDQLRLTYNRGRLEFPRVLSLPFSERALTAPVVTISDERSTGAGFRLVLKWDLANSVSNGTGIQTVPGEPFAFVSPRGGGSGIPPQVASQGAALLPGGEIVILRADRALNPEQGRGRWLVQINPRAFRLNLPRGTRDGTYPGTLRVLLYPSP